MTRDPRIDAEVAREATDRVTMIDEARVRAAADALHAAAEAWWQVVQATWPELEGPPSWDRYAAVMHAYWPDLPVPLSLSAYNAAVHGCTAVLVARRVVAGLGE